MQVRPTIPTEQLAQPLVIGSTRPKHSIFYHVLWSRVSVPIILTLLVLIGVAIVGCGKPDKPTVEYTRPDGKKTANIQELQQLTNTEASYEIRDGGAVPAQAEELHRQARVKGEAGEYPAALDLLRQAADIAPTWAYPHYDMAFTYLLQGDVTNAFSQYKEVDRLEPKGFFTTKTALWTLEREWSRVFPQGTYLTYASLEWAEPAKQKQMIEGMNTNLPAFAPAWKERALLATATDQRLAFFETALSLNPDAETYGLCMLNKAALLHGSGNTTEAERILNDLVQNEATTMAARVMAEQAQKTFKKGRSP
jgi:tetratricopeptide (TPR) repeat protein